MGKYYTIEFYCDVCTQMNYDKINDELPVFHVLVAQITTSGISQLGPRGN